MLRFLISLIAILGVAAGFIIYYNYIARYHRVRLYGRKSKTGNFQLNTRFDLISVLNMTDNYKKKEDQQIFQLLAMRKLPVVVCLGDSITHGIISTNYVERLQTRYQGKYLFVNAGINGNLAYNLQVRLSEDCIKLDPDYITILIGTNDVNSRKDCKTLKQYMKYQHLPQPPDKDFYRVTLQQIVVQLKQQTRAKIALLSLPVIGEHLDDKLNHLVGEYCTVIRQVAEENGLTYLPLNEWQHRFLTKLGKRVTTRYRKKNLLLNLLLMIGRSFDKIAAINGRFLTYDGLHETTRGAEMIEELIVSFLDGSKLP